MAQASDKKPGFVRPALSRRPQRPRQELVRTSRRVKLEHEDEKLDEALEETFPASDPAVSTPRKS